MDITSQIVQRLLSIKYEDIPFDVVTRTKDFILDTLGVAIAGSTAPGCKQVVDQIRDWGGKRESSIWTFGEKVPSPNAAFVNSMMAHARDFDDTHDRALLHANSSVVPATFAVGECQQVSGKDLITAIAVGVDFVCRMGLALLPDKIKKSTFSKWHLSAVCGAFGAAVASGKLLNLDQEGIHNCLGIVYSQVAGTRQAREDGALAKRMQPAFSARAGVFSAILAQKGITGAKDIMEGKYGFFNVYRENDAPYDIQQLTAKLGEKFEVLNLSMKPYPCARPTHPFITAALKVVQDNSIKPEQIKKIVVRSSSRSAEAVGRPFQIRTNPQVDAQFSIPYTVAVAILRGKVGLSDFEEDAVKDPAVQDMAKKVTVVKDASFNGWIPAMVKVYTKGRRRYFRRENMLKGSPNNPLTTEEVAEKFRECVKYSARTISKQNVEKLVSNVNQLEKINNIAQITQLFY